MRERLPRAAFKCLAPKSGASKNNRAVAMAAATSTLRVWLRETSIQGAALATDSLTSLSLLPANNQVQAKKQIHCKLYKKFQGQNEAVKNHICKNGVIIMGG